MIFEKLRQNKNLSEVERGLAAYILKNPGSVVEMNIRELAQASFSSPSTITRLCRKLGTRGYTDFKVRLSGELHQEENGHPSIDANVPFSSGDSMEKIAKTIADISMESIQGTYRSLQYGRMENIVRCMMKSQRIDVYGEGDSLYAAFEFKNKMLRIGRTVCIEMGVTQQSYQALGSDPSHCAVLISYSGENKNVIKVADILHKRRVPIVLITSEESSTLCRYASFIIHTGAQEKPLMVAKLTTYGSQIAVHYVLDVLFSFIYAKNYDENRKTAIENEMYLDRI